MIYRLRKGMGQSINTGTYGRLLQHHFDALLRNGASREAGRRRREEALDALPERIAPRLLGHLDNNLKIQYFFLKKLLLMLLVLVLGGRMSAMWNIHNPLATFCVHAPWALHEICAPSMFIGKPRLLWAIALFHHSQRKARPLWAGASRGKGRHR